MEYVQFTNKKGSIMQARRQVKPTSGYDQMYKIGGAALNGTMTAGSNVLEAAKTPIQPGAEAYQVHAAGFSLFTSAAVIDLFSGNWLRAGFDAAVSTYCAVGLINQIGKDRAMTLAMSAPRRFIGLFSSATPAPTPSAPQDDANNEFDKPKFQ